MKVKMLTRMAGPDGVLQPGSLTEVRDELGKNLVKGGYAEQIIEKAKTKRKKRGPKVETAQAPPAPETTAVTPIKTAK